MVRMRSVVAMLGSTRLGQKFMKGSGIRNGSTVPIIGAREFTGRRRPRPMALVDGLAPVQKGGWVGMGSMFSKMGSDLKKGISEKLNSIPQYQETKNFAKEKFKDFIRGKKKGSGLGGRRRMYRRRKLHSAKYRRGGLIMDFYADIITSAKNRSRKKKMGNVTSNVPELIDDWNRRQAEKYGYE